MKRTTFICITLLLAAIISTCLLIPQQLTLTQTISIDVSEINASKFLLHKENWKKWWPGEHSSNDNRLFTYNNQSFQYDQSTNSGVTLWSNDGDYQVENKITFSAYDNLKVRINWTTTVNCLNRIKRVGLFYHAKKVNRDVAAILQHLKDFLENERNVYGFNIRLNKVKDPVMLATSVITNNYPDAQVIEGLIQKLRKQIKDQNGLETNQPMLNINQIGKTQYNVMVAIPINKEIKPGSHNVINKMVLGNILEADVKGGPNTVKDAFDEVRLFVKDYRFTSPAMPFESMVTDRSMEKDTSKWLTKIYYPIF